MKNIEKIIATTILIGLVPGLGSMAAEATDYLAIACLHRNANQCGAINEKGQWVIRPDFDTIGDFTPNGLAIASKRRRTGVINVQGQWVLQPNFDQVKMTTGIDGLVKVARGKNCNQTGHLYNLVSVLNQVIKSPEFKEIQPFGPNHLAGAQNQEGYWGFITTAGAWAIEPIFDRVEIFDPNGLAPARRQGETLWGYINSTGTWAIPPRFDQAFPFDDSIAKVATGEFYGLIDPKGSWVTKTKFASLGDFGNDGLALAQKEVDGLYGFVNRSGDWVVKPLFQHLHEFGRSGLAAAQQNGLYGFINRTGQWIIKPTYDNVNDFESQTGQAPVEKAGAWGLIDRQGKWIVEPKYLMIISTGESGLMQIFTEERRWGLMDEKGRWVINPVLTASLYFSENGLSEARVGELYGFINRHGQWVVKPIFQQVGAFRPVLVNPPPAKESSPSDQAPG
ncbi:MAG: hypothetical protein AMR96_02030 [Candidatus Adiutrix intracellularis]|nr:MAG: hypothetical protein AMR96_02030 [Candidatus Adiutrix intracellularis]MDR2826925.1 WG repeat-containing protein [Candidatus Adiutrix intracellularis]